MTMRLSPGIRTATIAALLAAWIAPCDAGESYTWLETDPGEYTLACDMASGAGELRLAFDCVDDETLGYVRVQDGKAALWRVAGGQPERVTEPAAIQTGANWRATLQRREGRVRLIAGGRVVIDAEWPGPIAGRTGTLVGGAAKVEDTLVQPYEPPIIVDDFTRDAGETGGWETREGAWKNTMVAAPRAEAAKSANPFTVRAAAAPTALMTTGSWFWDTYRASVSVRPVDCEAVAVAAYVQDAENMVLFRWHAGSDDATKARELVMVREGKETVLASGAGGYVPGHWYRMELNVRPGHVEGLIDRFVAISADTDAFGEGAVGLWCGAGEAVFDDMTVGSPEATELGLPRLNPIFLADETMTANELYTPAGQWRAGNGATWHWGDYAHDVRLSIPVAALPDSPTGVLLAADGTDPGSGYAATLIKAGAEINVTLARQGAPVAEGACAAGESIAVTVTDGTVAVASPGGEAVSFTDPEPLAGRHLGLTGTVDAIVMQAEVTSDHLHDYAFDSAPTDWFGSKGIWQVTTRWPCQPVWTFFGGAHDENPVLWSKHEYKGDVTLEFFGNVKMDAPPPPGYTRPSDVNAALCSDGQDLGSGYAFVFAGWKNTKTAIIRKGQVVAETTDAVFVEPTSSNVNFHRHWFRIRARKMGNRISLSVDGREVLAYEDPEPIASGRAGIWSFHNGLMIGRARLWFDEELPGGVLPCRMTADAQPETQARVADAPISDEFETSLGEWQTFGSPATTALSLDPTTSAGGKQSLRVTNLTTGGAFGAYAVMTAFRATESPRLSFDFRMQPSARVNIYVYSGTQWHAVGLAADEPDSGDITVIGKIEGILADDQWHHAEFDIATPLSALYPESKTLEVKYIAFAAPEESYLRCGLGGNGRGATYWLDNFRIGE